MSATKQLPSFQRVTIERAIHNEETWTKVPFRKDTPRTTECVLCQYGAPSPKERTQPALRNLWLMFSDNFGKMSNEELSECMFELFEAEIRKPMAEQGYALPKATAESFLVHIEQHMVSPVMNAVNGIRAMKAIERVL